MKTTNNSITIEKLNVSQSTIDRTPPRALAFLSTLSANPALRAQLEPAGYTEADHSEGWSLLEKAQGFGGVVDATPANGATRAKSELEEFVATMIPRARGALLHKHFDQEAFVFAGFDVNQPSDPSIVVALFLERLQMLEDGAERKASRKEDHAALATLDQRGIGKKVRERVAKLVDEARSLDFTDASPPKAAAQKKEDLVALYLWTSDWMATARTVFTRRDQLARLGIVKRRTKKSTAPVPDVVPPVVVKPVAPVAPAAPIAPQAPVAPAVAPAPSGPQLALVPTSTSREEEAPASRVA